MRTLQWSICVVLTALTLLPSAHAQQQDVSSPNDEVDVSSPSVGVRSVADDTAIDDRLTGILDATGWFRDAAVSVRNGVVFLDGRTTEETRKEWAGNLARNTEDVVAVVNRIDVVTPVWSFAPALEELSRLWRSTIQAVPVIVFAAVVLPVTWFFAGFVSRRAERALEGRTASPLLTRILARAIAVPFFLLGLYIVLQVAGLTRLALTVVGGTGIAGIIVGFAFRDIAENFLASVLLSIRRPFLTNDLIEVAGHRGLVRQMNTRSTVLMTPDGNHIQIPNATIFKSTIVNLTANKNARSEFEFTIGYDYSIRHAQNVVHNVLRAHPAVLEDPAPWVLVDNLGSSSIVMRAYYWFDFSQVSEPKLKSALLRQSLRALEKAGISAPDDAREIIFPQGVPVLTGDAATKAATTTAAPTRPVDLAVEDAVVEHDDEGGLASDAPVLQEQAESARTPEEGENLL